MCIKIILHLTKFPFLVHLYIHKYSRGAAGTKSIAFRKQYGNLVELRSLFVTHVPFIALTATAMPSVERTIVANLKLKTPMKFIASPNRLNIFYTNVHVNNDITKSFRWLVEELKENKLCKRTIIFCHKKEHAQDLFRMFFTEFPEYSGSEHTVNPFEYFHSGTKDYLKEQIVDSFSKSDGIVRILMATSAFGVGVDCKNTSRIIHVGPPIDVDDYLQESGRAGRDGLSSEACLLLHSGYASGRKLSPYMKEYVENRDNCRRTLLMKTFGINDPDKGDICCDVCNEGCSTIPFPCISADTNRTLDKSSKFHPETKDMLMHKLKDYWETTIVHGLSGTNFTSGCPRSVPSELLKNIQNIHSAEDVYLQTSVTDIQIANYVYPIFHQFRDELMFPNQDYEHGLFHGEDAESSSDSDTSISSSDESTDTFEWDSCSIASSGTSSDNDS